MSDYFLSLQTAVLDELLRGDDWLGNMTLLQNLADEENQ